MPTDQAEGFADNWTYLKAELQWLDRVLVLAVARQRKEAKEIDRVAQSKADQATSHWWKGVVALEGSISYDEHRQPAQPAPKSQQQHLEQRIQISRQQGKVLALPELCDRLQLTSFEKNLVLMSLAPELNRRYARLYRFLRGEEAVTTDLPSLDLVLKLFCRNDTDWRSARSRLMENSPLTRYQLLQLLPGSEDTLLNCSLKLQETTVNYLMADQPTVAGLDQLLNGQKNRPNEQIGHIGIQQPVQQSAIQQSVRPVTLYPVTKAVDWADLVLPSPLIESLQYLEKQIQGYAQAEALWGFQAVRSLGIVALLAGATGTGKTMAAQAIAHALQAPLFQLDLAQIEPVLYPQVFQDLAMQGPAVLLIQSAELGLGQSAAIGAAVQQFFAQRHQSLCLTLLSTSRTSAIRASWRQQIDQVLIFPLPGERDRLQLWKRAFPAQVPLATDIKWKALAQLPLTGGEIGAIVQAAVLYAAAIEAPKVSMTHVSVTLAQRGLTIPPTRKKS